MPSISKKFGTGGNVNYTYGGKGQINKQRTRSGSIYGVQKNVPNINLDKDVGLKEGGKVATKKLFGGKESAAEELKEAKALKSGKISKSQYVAGEKSEGHGAGAAKTATAIKSGKISPKQYAQAETMMKKGGATKCCGGGKIKKMASGGLAAGHKSADGIATKGKTKARAVTMKKGGKC